MNMESLTASLHAGLIQRARPAKVVPLRDDAHSGAPSGRAPVVQLRASDVARSRAVPAPLGKGEFPAREIPVRDDPARGLPARVLARLQAVSPVGRLAGRAGGAAVFPRFGLTVRVGSGLRDLLLQARSRSGRTTQSILHDALVAYLGAEEREQTGR